MTQPTHQDILRQSTTVEAFAAALEVSLHQILGPNAIQAEAIVEAVRPVARHRYLVPFEALFADTVQTLLRRVGVDVLGARSMSAAEAWAKEGKKYVLASPKLDPQAHQRRSKAHEERLREEAAYELKKSLDPQLVNAMRPMLRMTPMGF